MKMYNLSRSLFFWTKFESSSSTTTTASENFMDILLLFTLWKQSTSSIFELRTCGSPKLTQSQRVMFFPLNIWVSVTMSVMDIMRTYLIVPQLPSQRILQISHPLVWLLIRINQTLTSSSIVLSCGPTITRCIDVNSFAREDLVNK